MVRGRNRLNSTVWNFFLHFTIHKVFIRIKGTHYKANSAESSKSGYLPKRRLHKRPRPHRILGRSSTRPNLSVSRDPSALRRRVFNPKRAMSIVNNQVTVVSIKPPEDSFFDRGIQRD